jgi:pyruvate kinase
MLSGETAIGRFPVESVRAIDRITRAVEPSLGYRHELARTAEQPFPTVRDAVTNAACDIAEVLSAKAIVVPTFSGKTASGVARHRPRRPVVAASHRHEALRQMAIEWGVIPCEIEEGRDVEDIWARALEAARTCGVVLPGDRVVITAGSAVNLPGTTNLIKVETA